MCASPRCTWSGGLRTAIPILYVLGFPIRVTYSRVVKFAVWGSASRSTFFLVLCLLTLPYRNPRRGFVITHLSHMRVMGVKSTCEIPRHGREVKNVIQIEHANVTPL